jgi:hypothetical protein
MTFDTKYQRMFHYWKVGKADEEEKSSDITKAHGGRTSLGILFRTLWKEIEHSVFHPSAKWPLK